MEQYTQNQISAIREQMELEALLSQQSSLGGGGNAGGDQLSDTMRTPSAIEKIANALGRKNKPKLYDPEQDFSQGQQLSNGGTMLGDTLYNAMPSSASEKIAGVLKSAHGVLENPYQVSGAQFAEDGYTAAQDGYNEGDYVKMAGGAGMMAMPLVPYSKVGMKALSTTSGALGGGLAMSAAPLAAQEAFKASPAYAAGETNALEEASDKIGKYGPSMAVGAISALLGAGMMKRHDGGRMISAQQEAKDIARVLENRETARLVKQDHPFPQFNRKIDSELKDIEPSKYNHLKNDDLEELAFSNSKFGAQLGTRKANEGFGRVGAGIGAATAYAAQPEEETNWTSVIAGALGGFGSAKMAPSFRREAPHYKSKIDRFDPVPDPNPYKPNGPSEQLKLNRSPVADAHPKDYRKPIEERLSKGETVKDLSEEYGMSQSTLYRWKRKLKKDNPEN